MLLYDRFLSADTPKTNRQAWVIMLGVYSVISVAGIIFLIQAVFLTEQIQWKTLVQSLIMLALGSGGVLISLKGKK
jgi:hypothetical protein